MQIYNNHHIHIQKFIWRCLAPFLTMLLSMVSGTVLADDTPVMNDSSYYEISTAAQLKWFATKVNAGDQSINGVLTADIDLSTLGEDYWTPIGYVSEEIVSSKTYKGKFNGDNHVIRGLVLRKAAASGLFGYTEGARISNIIIVEAIMRAEIDAKVSFQYGIGAVCGLATAGTVIDNCQATLTQMNYFIVNENSQKDIDCVGGIVGELRNSSALNCTADGFVRTDGKEVGGIVGFVNVGLVKNCKLVDFDGGHSSITGLTYVGGIAGYVKGRGLEYAIIDCTVADSTEVTAVGYYDTYTETNDTTASTICGKVLIASEPEEWDGFYEIYTPDQLKWFASLVNGGSTKKNARLMNSLNMSKAGTFTPIGTESNPFAGEFDGQEFTIDSLTINKQKYAGLFGYVKDGRVRNLTLTNPSLNSGDNDYQGLIVGFLTQNPGNATCMSYIENCYVTNGNLYRGEDGSPDYVGGIVGKIDMSAEVRDCSFQGIIKAHENRIGGIAGYMDSGAKLYRCITIGPSTVWGNDYVGGVVGYMTDNATLIDNCFANQAGGEITVHAEGSNYSGLVRGYDKSGTADKSLYTEGNLQYALTGFQMKKEAGNAKEVYISNTGTQGKGTYYAITDIGTKYKYFTTKIEKLPGVEELYFWDNNSNIAGTEACGWINMKIDDYAFDSGFKKLWMKYKMFAGDDHDVMLRPDDVTPAGLKMLENCPDARIYVDAEYYNEFVDGNTLWSRDAYKNKIIPTTAMRTEDVNALYGARYAYDRNRDKTGSIVNKDNGTIYGVDQVHVIGADDSWLNDASNNGVLWIYQDIGETYDYNTTKVWASSFKGKDNIKQVKFQAITKSGRRPSQEFNIELGDSAFANCKNLTAFNVALYSDKGKDHVEMLHPKDMPLGEGVFDGCPNLKIYVDPALLSEFRNDAAYGWYKYRDIIYASDNAWDEYTEDGVKYGFYTSTDGQTRYTNKNREEMEAILEPWSGELNYFTPNSVLCTNNSSTIYYMVATGVDPDDSDIKDGKLNIYNDIGNAYNYKTIALSATGFRGNTQIESISFTDCAGNNGNAKADLSLIIPSGAFEGCSNLKELNMFQYITNGTNHYESIKPSQILIGKDVFTGVHRDFRIKVLPGLYDDYIKDPNWSQYKDLIIASDYVPIDKDDITRSGVTYGYATNTLNTVATSSTVKLQTSLWNVPIIIAETISLAVDIHSLLEKFGVKAAQVAETSVTDAATETYNKAISQMNKKIDAAHWELFENPSTNPNENWYVGLAQKDKQTKWLEYMKNQGVKRVKLQSTLTNAAAKAAEQIATRRLYAVAGTLTAYGLNGAEGTKQLSNATSYLTNRVSKSFEQSPSVFINQANWVTTKQRTNAPQMYVKAVDDRENVTIYVNPEESTGHMQTVAIGRTTFHDKKNLKSVNFCNRVYSNEPLEPMTMYIPDGCFYGCDNFKTLDLVLDYVGYSYDGAASCKKALTPDNFLLTGDIFEGCDTTKIRIRVGKKVLQQFLDDSFWGKYKTMYEPVDVIEAESQSTEGCRYTYTFDENTMPLESQSDGQNIRHLDIFGPDDTALGKSSGKATLVNDYGLVRNYKLDNVKADAFKGNTKLVTLDITDSNQNTGDVYTAFNVVLQDSAFAHCPNFKEFNLIYQKTDGGNATESIIPSQVTLGKGVFEDTPKLSLKICLDQEEAFFSDLSWMAYADKIKPCLFDPRDSKVFKLLKDKYLFNDDSDWNHIDAMRVGNPEELRDLFKGTDIRSFDEFRAFGTCGLKAVYQNMFSGCTALQSIILPDSITSIEKYAFKDCSLLTQLSIPENVTYIGDEAFTGSALNKIVVNNPQPIPMDAAKVFSGLLSDNEYIIYVPDSVVDLYKQKWSGVANHINGISTKRGLKVINLTKVNTLADSLRLYIQSNILYDEVMGNVAQYDSLRISGPLDGHDILVLRALGGRDIKNEKNGTGHLRYLDLYDAELKDSWYSYNHKTLDNKWDEWTANSYISHDGCVGTFMFSGFTDLETLILPKDATDIRAAAFKSLPNLNTVVVGEKMEDVYADAASDCPSMKYLVMLADKVPDTNSKAWSFQATSTLNKTNLTGGTTLSGSYNRLAAIIGSPKSFGNYFVSTAYSSQADSIACLFQDEAVFNAMKKAHIFSPYDLANTTRINGVVNGNTDVKIFNELAGSSVTLLDEGTLTGMSNMVEMTLPLTLDSISADAFKGCSSLKDIYALSATTPALATGAFNDLPTNFVITVVEGYEDQYRKAWPEYASHIKGYRPELNIREVTLTEKNTLADSLGLTVHMSGSCVSTITGDMAGITALKVNGPIGGKDVAVLRMLGGREPEWDEQSYATNLKYLNLYDAQICKDDIYFTSSGINRKIDNDNVIPKKFLKNCYNLETVILPKTVTKIDDEAFYNMYSLQTLVLGDDLNDIDGDDAFGESQRLVKMVFLCNQKPSLHHDAFTDAVAWYDHNYKVENMYVKKDINDSYTNDTQYQDHANHITSVFSNDDLFRAYGSRGVATEDDLGAISAITGWFTKYDNITDLSSLSKSNITRFGISDVSNISSLQNITLPSTLKYIDDNTFENNKDLNWVDLGNCDSLQTNVENLGVHSTALVYAPKSYNTTAPVPMRSARSMMAATIDVAEELSNTANIVYGDDEDNLTCDEYLLTTDRAYDVPRGFTAKKIVLDRKFTPQTYSTIILPFGMKKLPAGFKMFKLNSDAIQKVAFNRVYSTEANVPYIVWAEKEKMTIESEAVVLSTPDVPGYLKDKGYVLTGTYFPIKNSVAVDIKSLSFDESTQLWNLIPFNDNITLEPFTAYLKINEAGTPTTDVPNVFLDPQYFYSVGTTKHMLDGEDVKSLSTDEMTLVDAQDFKADEGITSFTADKATYTREMSTTWGTLCLPYAYEATGNETCEFYEMTENKGSSLVLTKLTGTIAAGRPVMVRRRYSGVPVVISPSEAVNVCTSEGTSNMLSGSFTETIVPEGSYIISKDKFWLVDSSQNTSGAKIKAYRGYVTTTGAQPAKLNIAIKDETTGIDELNSVEDDAHAEYYNLDGRRTNGLQKGLNIIKSGTRVVKVMIR